MDEVSPPLRKVSAMRLTDEAYHYALDANAPKASNISFGFSNKASSKRKVRD